VHVDTADYRGLHFFSILKICHKSLLATHGTRPVMGELGHNKHSHGKDMNHSIDRRQANEQETAENKYPKSAEHPARQVGRNEFALFN
jgi:hypothetical protein